MLINSKIEYDNTKSVKDLDLSYTKIEDAVFKIQQDHILLNT